MQEALKLSDSKEVRFSFPCLRAVQPIGDMYIGVLPFNVLCAIADFDVRRVLQEDRDIERYLGIQRPLNPSRVRELKDYVNFSDASFPGSIIIAVDERCVSYNAQERSMMLSNVISDDDPVLARQIAKVIDGQHRIAGLYAFRGETFDCVVTLLVGMDISDQGQMFARVNLSQTKVNPSLALDLYELSRARSPQKTCHDITVVLDREIEGPFWKRIKRLGVATDGRKGELLTQATIVKGLMPFISNRPDLDRDLFLRGKTPVPPFGKDAERLLFRQWFLNGQDEQIIAELNDYFEVVRDKWDGAWNNPGRGDILPRTNGYFALMRLLRDMHLLWAMPGERVTKEQFQQTFDKIELESQDLTTANYEPGTGGEARLYADLRAQALG